MDDSSDARRRSFRLLLRVYPRDFREEYGPELLAHLACQRRESRYATPVGSVRFWVGAAADAVATASRLRAAALVASLKAAWYGDGRGTVRPVRIMDPVRERAGVGTMLEMLLMDVRLALRGLAKNPGYAVVFMLTLGLGIGANTAMFSAVNGVLLRPLPHEDGDRLVYLRHSAREIGVENALFSVPEIGDYRRGTRSLRSVAEFSAMPFTLVVDGEGPRRVMVGIVTGNYFEAMGLSARLGRTIQPRDDGAGAASVIVLSDRYWRRAFGSDPTVIGKSFEVIGTGPARSATVIGVSEPAPPYPEQTDIFVNMAASPHHLDATMAHDRTHRMTEAFARLAPGATIESTRAEVESVTARLHADHPEAYDEAAGYAVSVTPLKKQLTARARPTLLLLLGTAVFVLIIACANLANLTLTRVLQRDHELAIRASLGASRGALRRQLLVESLLLAGAGAILGVLFAAAGLDLIIAFAERFTSRAAEIVLDGRVLGFAVLTAVAASVFFALVPTLPEGDAAGEGLRRSGVRTTVGSSSRRTQRGLVVAQIATSFVLLVGAGLLVRTMLHLSRIDPGFDLAPVLSMDLPVDYGQPPSAIRSRFMDMLDDVRALRGVEQAALTNRVPLEGEGIFGSHSEFSVEGYEPAAGAPRPRAEFRVISPGYFATLGIDVLRGREFATTDLADAGKVVVINESLSRTYFDDIDAVGRRLAWTDENFRFMGLGKEWRTVVGVVADTRDEGLDAPPPHIMYTPYGQVTPYAVGSLVVRTSEEPTALVPAIRRVILAKNPRQPIEDIATLEELGSASRAGLRLNTILLTGFAGLALVIAAVGLGGVLAFSVGSRRREFGVRSAIGAARHQIWSAVLAEGGRLAIVGVVVGTVGALILTRFMTWLLVGVPAIDPLTFFAVGLLLSGVTVVAAWSPAWRAARVSPIEALSTE